MRVRGWASAAAVSLAVPFVTGSLARPIFAIGEWAAGMLEANAMAGYTKECVGRPLSFVSTLPRHFPLTPHRVFLRGRWISALCLQ